MADELTPEQVAIETEALNRVDGIVADTLADYNDDGTVKEELILGKFKTAEDLQKAYTELEKKLSTPKDVVPADTTPPKTDEVPKAVEGLLAPKDFEDFSKEYNDSGSLSEDTYKSLEKKGLSKEIVDGYITGQKAVAESKASKLLEYVGGKDIYNQMIDWAKTNYSPEQAKAFDSSLFSGDELKVQEQVDLLSFRMSKANQTPRRLEGDSVSASSGAKAFESKVEYQKYVSNPLYGRDAKYSAMVDNRYLKSLDVGTL